MICLDSTFLGLLLHPEAKAPTDPTTKLPIERLPDRLELLRETWVDDHEKVMIPTPVLSEFLILAGRDGPTYLEKIHNTSNFVIEPFDEMAAVELAALHVAANKTKSKAAQKRAHGGTWAKIKFDRQIVAIAKAHGASAIYSDDKGVGTFAEQNGLEVIKTWTLPLPSAVAVPLPGCGPEDFDGEPGESSPEPSA